MDNGGQWTMHGGARFPPDGGTRTAANVFYLETVFEKKSQLFFTDIKSWASTASCQHTQ